MKIPYLIFIILFIGLGSQSNSIFAQQDIQVIIDHYFDNRGQYEAFMAEVEFGNKSFSSEDTLRTTAMVEFVRNAEDTVFSGHLFVQTKSKAYAYDGERALFGDIHKSTIIINEFEEIPDRMLIHDWARNFIETSFLTNNQMGRSIMHNPDVNTTISDTVIGEWPCKGILMKMPDQDEFKDLTIFIAIDTEEYMLRQRSISLMFQENEQYQSWDYKNPTYGNQAELTKLNDDFLSSFKHQELYEYVESDTTSIASAKVDYSTLEGQFMGTQEPFDIKVVDADIFILDFWYSACYPCIKSIPEVNKVFELFDDRAVAVYGVNIIDDESKNKSRIEKYVRNNPMSYKTIMADRVIYDEWISEGYPMLLILDSDFQLIHMHSGYTEGMANKIAEIIEEHLYD